MDTEVWKKPINSLTASEILETENINGQENSTQKSVARQKRYGQVNRKKY